jgi:hypothetical protein
MRNYHAVFPATTPRHNHTCGYLTKKRLHFTPRPVDQAVLWVFAQNSFGGIGTVAVQPDFVDDLLFQNLKFLAKFISKTEAPKRVAAMFNACRAGRVDTVHEIVSKDRSALNVAVNGCTPVYIAAQRGHFAVVSCTYPIDCDCPTALCRRLLGLETTDTANERTHVAQRLYPPLQHSSGRELRVVGWRVRDPHFLP